MDTTPAVPVPKPFIPHPNFSDEVNRNIVQSEIEGGVCSLLLKTREGSGLIFRQSEDFVQTNHPEDLSNLS